MTPQARLQGRKLAVVSKLQEIETEAHSVGLHATAHFINAAKNKCGWEIAGEPEKARECLTEYRA